MKRIEALIRKTILVMVTLTVLFGAGCATTNGKANEGPKYTGFLSDYSQLKPYKEGSTEMRYVNPQADLKKYRKYIIERIIVWLKDDADYKGFDPDQMKALTDYFREAIVRELGSAYPVVTEPGPDTMRLRIAITDLVPTKTGYSFIMLAAPFGSAADLLSGAASKGGAGSAPYLGHAGIEAEAIDSETLQVVWADVDQRFAKKYDLEHPGEYFKSYSEWAYVKGAFDYWAKLLRQRRDEVFGVKPAQEK